MDWNARILAALAECNPAPEPDVVEELAQHAEAAYNAARADGRTRDEADAATSALIRNWVREAETLRRPPRRAPAVVAPPTAARWLTGLVQDLRHAARLLRRQPRFALLATLTISLGIAATSLLFSVSYGVLMKPLPWPHADRIVLLKETRGGKAPRFGAFTNAAYLAWRDDASTVEDLAAWSVRTATLTGAGDPERIQVVGASPSLFRVLGAGPLVGSLFHDGDAARSVVVLSESLWRQRFGADHNVIGRVVRLDDEPRTVIGVLPAKAGYPSTQAEAWVPFEVRSAAGNYLSLFSAIAKLRPGVTPDQAAAEGTGRGRFAENTGMTTTAIFGGDGPVEITATPLQEALTGDMRRPLLVQLGAVVLLLLIATTNVASLQLARAMGARREFAIRAALGASGGRIMRQLLAESLLLGLAGGAIGLGVALLLFGRLPSILPADFPRVSELTFDRPVVIFTAAVAILSSIAFGLLPALRMRRMNVAGSLAAEGVSPVGMSARSGVARTRLALIAGQVAVSCVLLVAAALLGRTFIQLLNADRGFNPSQVISAALPMTGPAYSPELRQELIQRIVGRLAIRRDAAFTSEQPLTPGGSTASFTLPPRNAGGVPTSVQASPRVVSARYFSTLGTRVLAGRAFDDSDTETSQAVAVVNDAFAREYLAGSALGVKIPNSFWGGDARTEATIVGVVEDVHYIGGPVRSQPEMYSSDRQLKGRFPFSTTTLLVRVDGDADSAARDIRAIVRDAHDGLVAGSIMTLEDRLVATSLARPRVYAVLLGSFAALGLLLTGVGLFAVLSHVVAQRTRELGVRAALGASRLDLIWLVMGQGLAVTAAGLVVGLSTAALLARLTETLLYGVSPGDASTYVGVAGLVLLVAMLASFLPALRAARLDPLRALRA